MKKSGFDSKHYIERQSSEIAKRISQLGGKLYLEFGGKLFDDNHASRVLPGFEPDIKVRMLKELAEKVEVVIVINASDIVKSKVRGDLGIKYSDDVLRLIDAFRGRGLFVGSVVITRYEGEIAADNFRAHLEKLGVPVYLHYPIEGYPFNTAKIASDDGFGKNQYVKTTHPLVVVTAPGPGSGKMAVCLSQLYHENLRGTKAGYAKFETFPIWNLPLNHPVNIAYEAATLDLNDVNMIDHYHLDKYGISTVNYNRDIEVFPLLNTILKRVGSEGTYHSPTDMGVNMAGYAIADDKACRHASCMEIIRRYYHTMCDFAKGGSSEEAVSKIEHLMNQAGITPDDRQVIAATSKKAADTGLPALCIELPDGKIVCGKTSDLLGPAAAALLNAVKSVAGIDPDVDLIAGDIMLPIQLLKTSLLGNVNPRLHSDEILIALSMAAASGGDAKLAFDALPLLSGCEAHSSVIVSQVDNDIYRKLGINLTTEPVYQHKKLFHN